MIWLLEKNMPETQQPNRFDKAILVKMRKTFANDSFFKIKKPHKWLIVSFLPQNIFIIVVQISTVAPVLSARFFAQQPKLERGCFV